MLENNHLMMEEKPGSSDEPPDPQVKPKTIRRAFTTAYKVSILEQADQCQGHGEVGALLRREGLYSSHLSSWRRLRREGTLQALKHKKHGPKPTLAPVERRELEQLRRRNAKLEQELEKARTIIDVQKKLSSILAAMPDDKESS
jgi:transposase-like protein|tara:strand:- start:1225 stop:1656 length:432 start_codon:yes stop_codon:yes gene_type:complete